MIPPAMTEATKKISRRIQDVSDDEQEDEEVVVATLLFLSIKNATGKRDVSSSGSN